jgi:RNA polymerase sigma factor (TIGR02999 family)
MATPHQHEDELFRSLYAELRRQAELLMHGQRRDHTLQATALVHEVLLRVWDGKEPAPEDRQRFLATAAKAMRHVLVDHARGRGRDKRTPPGSRLPLDQVSVAFEERAFDLLLLDEALERLDAADPTMARAVDLRFFGGLPAEEVARMLGMPLRTFERRWSVVRAWLATEIA